MTFLDIIDCGGSRPPASSTGNFHTQNGVPSGAYYKDFYVLDKDTGRLYRSTGSGWVFDYQFGSGGGSSQLPEVLITTTGSLPAINWATDKPSGNSRTWQQLFGDDPVIVEEDKNDDGTWSPNGTPGYTWNTNKTTLTFYPGATNARFIITS